MVPAGVVCRTAADECDLPEFCSGMEAACPDDVFQQNGNLCNQGINICFNGKCQSADLQCKHIFGPDSKSASYECYQELNVIGDRFGNCGGVQGYYAKCDKDDVLCGKIQCAITGEVKINIKNAAVSFYTPKNETCVNADFFTSDFVDPVQVRDGTKCGENKVYILTQIQMKEKLGF
ncbi:Hypothetical predicted protein [Pelobates cultripes]|uniref:ADAM cysteine-rich domain-containing protein n=1 Tax=Pelobates cultripes TaxID=61616 RepID=A0AAD1RMQ8_PELCU|nr:Hypothetical predicted protein [Pelobates cultripes]